MAKTKASETVTENIFRNFHGSNTFIEKSAIPKEYGFVSKKKSGNDGYPDFFKDENSFCIIVEAKAEKHDDAKKEVQFYMLNNTINKDSIGIAVSGQSERDLMVTYYLCINGSNDCSEISDCNELLSVSDIEKLYKKAKFKEITTEEHLSKTLNSLNKQFQDEDIVRDTERSLFFSGVMIALKDSTFRSTYKTIHAPSKEEASASRTKLLEAHLLNESIVNAITRQLDSKINNLSKEYNWRDKFAFIKTIDYSLVKYKKLIETIENNIFAPFENEEKQDILGRAYKIFLSKAGKVDNKNIILTPDHIKSLMVKLARLTKKDVVLDTCMGSGGFLMESMETMIKLADTPAEIEHIKEHQLIGFEIDSVLFALACSNMFLHGDGRTNLIYRSSILNDRHENIVNGGDKELWDEIKKYKPTKVIINPPYESNKPILFVDHAIDYLEDNGRLIIIMPTPTLTQNQGGMTEKILKKAKLDFVIKMPEKLFTEQKRTVNTSVFGFTKTPQQQDDTVLFYDLSDDGFVSIQHKGRVDKNNTWSDREKAVVDAITSLTEEEGISEKRKIYRNGILNCAGIKDTKNSNFEMVKISELFNCTEKGSLASEEADEDGEYDFITASSEWKKHSTYDHECEAIIFAVAASGSLGRAHYVNGKFIASNLCLVLTPKKNSKYKVNMKFYAYFFNSIRESLRNDLADGTSKLTIKPKDLANYYIEYVPIEQQDKFCNDNIEAYEKLQEQLKKAEINLEKNISNIFNS